MKKLLTIMFIPFLFISLAMAAGPKKSVKVNIGLTPAGDFVATARPKGKLSLSGGKLSGTVTVSCKKLRTEVDLRDEHLHKKLECKKYPKIAMKVTGSGGVGMGLIKVRDIKKKIPFTYSPISGDYYKARFKLSLKDFKFSGIKYMGVGVDDKISIDVVMKVKNK
jgi:hypothetical protein